MNSIVERYGGVCVGISNVKDGFVPIAGLRPSEIMTVSCKISVRSPASKKAKERERLGYISAREELWCSGKESIIEAIAVARE